MSHPPHALYYRTATEADVPALARLISHAFAGPLDGSADWVKKYGMTDMRAVSPREDAPPEACLRRIDMGQFFGGKSVKMAGIAGVAVAPESRGKGLAKRMMQQALREAAADGFALSALYASTQSLYRSVGYEQAGHCFTLRIPIARIDVEDRAGDVAPLTDADRPQIEACYNAFARQFAGMLDRPAYIWDRIRTWRGEIHHPFGVRDDAGNLVGYVFLAQRRKEATGRQDVHLSDLAFSTAEGGRRILAFLGQFGTMADDIEFQAGPMHPLLNVLGEKKYELDLREYWMVRVLDVPRALESRGWSPAVRTDLHLRVHDPLIESNSADWLVHIENGRASVARGGRAEITMDIRALAPLSTGFMSARELALAGRLTGPETALDTATAAFAGPVPWMSDFF